MEDALITSVEGLKSGPQHSTHSLLFSGSSAANVSVGVDYRNFNSPALQEIHRKPLQFLVYVSFEMLDRGKAWMVCCPVELSLQYHLPCRPP